MSAGQILAGVGLLALIGLAVFVVWWWRTHPDEEHDDSAGFP